MVSDPKTSFDENQTKQPTPFFRDFRFSLRSFMLMMFACGIAIGAWSIFVNPFRMQMRAIEMVNQLGGQMTLQEADKPEWHRFAVVAFLGKDAFVEVLTLDLRETKVNDEHIPTLVAMQDLRELVIDGCKITDDGVRQLSALKQLELASLRYTSVSNDGLSAFLSMPNLRKLLLTGTDIDDAGLLTLAELSSLTEVYARWSSVSPKGVEEFNAMNPNCVVHAQLLAE